MPSGFTIYPNSDKTTEDLFLIDKQDAESYGLYDILDSIKYGHMRYGENIFDQESSLIQDGILAADLPDEEKQRLLGIHVFEELQTHPNNEAFVDGGKPKPKGNIASDFMEVSQFYNGYLNSPKYKERLKKQGYPNPDATIQERLDNVNAQSVDVVTDKGSYQQGNKIFINESDALNFNATGSEVMAHEFSHAAGAHPWMMNKTDERFINARNKYQFGPLKDTDPHQASPFESKADIDMLRFRLQQDGLYNTGTQDFNQDVLNKAKSNYGEEYIFKRLFQRFGDKALINLMNTVASNKKPNGTMSFAGGGKTVKGKSGKTYSLTPNKNAKTYTDQEGNVWEQAGQGFRVLEKAGSAKKPTARTRTSIAPKKKAAAQPDTVKKQLERFIPEIKPLAPIASFNKKGEAIYDNQLDNPDAQIKNRLLVPNADYRPTAVDQALNRGKNESTTVGAPEPREARESAFRRENIVGGLTSLANVGIGGLFAATPQPLYEPTAEYQTMRDDIYARKDQGLTAEQQAFLSQGVNNNYAQGIESIRQIGGGGANAGAVLSTLQGLSANMDRANAQNALYDIDAQNRNRSIYQDTVLRDQALDQQLFEQQRLDALETKNNGLAMVAQGVQSINDRAMYNQAYGPDSMYNELLESQIAGAQQYRDTERLQTELALENLRKAAGLSTLPVNPANKTTPTTTIPR